MLTSVLEAFTVYPTPLPPLHRGTNLTLRNRYYEVFLLNGAFTASGFLLCALEYAAGAGISGMMPTGLATQLAVFLAMSLPFQLCIMDYPFENYRTFLVPYLAVGCSAALLALAHLAWRSDGSKDRRCSLHPVCTEDADFVSTDNRNFNPVLSAYRVGLYISTLLCIFGRDLPCWNNRFSKSKAFGTGLMDLGIGCFALCLGLNGPTAARPMRLVKRGPTLQRCANQVLLLGCLGLGVACHRAWQFGNGSQFRNKRRAVFPAEWREYGVHWNAFCSLAVTRLLGTCTELLALPAWAPPALVAVAVATVHEIALTRAGLAELVLAPAIREPYNRSGLIGQNREGLASVPGLLALYLAGLQLGRWVRDWTAKGGGVVGSVKILGLLVATLAWRPVLMASGCKILPESRRLLSPSYCAWVLAFSCYGVLSAGLLASLRRRLSTGWGLLQLRNLATLDRSGMAAFLIGNVATGLFNAALNAAGISREVSLGGGWLCFLLTVAYAVLVQSAAIRVTELFARAHAIGSEEFLV